MTGRLKAFQSHFQKGTIADQNECGVYINLSLSFPFLWVNSGQANSLFYLQLRMSLVTCMNVRRHLFISFIVVDDSKHCS